VCVCARARARVCVCVCVCVSQKHYSSRQQDVWVAHALMKTADRCVHMGRSRHCEVVRCILCVEAINPQQQATRRSSGVVYEEVGTVV
jgi:hypothetical protein